MATMSSGKAQEAGRSIGAILVNSGRLALADVERIINFQKENDLRFGDAAMKLGILTEADIFYALSMQFDYPYLSGPGHPVSDEVVVAYRPFSAEGERLRSLRSQLQLRCFKEGASRIAMAVVGTCRGEGRRASGYGTLPRRATRPPARGVGSAPRGGWREGGCWTHGRRGKVCR